MAGAPAPSSLTQKSLTNQTIRVTSSYNPTKNYTLNERKHMPHIDEKELARNLAAKTKRREAAQKKQADSADNAREVAQKSLDKAGPVDVKSERQLADDRVKLLDDGSTVYEVKEDTTFREVALEVEFPNYHDLANFNGVWNLVHDLRKGQVIVIPPAYEPKLEDSAGTEKA